MKIRLEVEVETYGLMPLEDDIQWAIKEFLLHQELKWYDASLDESMVASIEGVEFI